MDVLEAYQNQYKYELGNKNEIGTLALSQRARNKSVAKLKFMFKYFVY